MLLHNKSFNFFKSAKAELKHEAKRNIFDIVVADTDLNDLLVMKNSLNYSFNEEAAEEAYWDTASNFFFNGRKSRADDADKGIVAAFKDSVVTISGLRGVQVNELIYFEGGASGLALNLEYGITKALVFGSSNSVKTLERVRRSKFVMQVGVGAGILGRILNPLGIAIDGLGDIKFEAFRPIEKKAPGVITRKKINEPIETGLKVVDSLVPIGRGQRELILGDRKTGKTTIAIDTILNQVAARHKLREMVSCVYVAVGKRMAEIVKLSRTLELAGALRYTALVVARASDPASLQFIAPYSACTMAEYFTYLGYHALIIYDDLSRHADAYRQISLLLRRPVGREAYPGDIFYLHSRLLERAVKLSIKLGAGSLTALPVVETIQGDVSAYIPTNVISITDGQIYLDLNRHQEGVRPAVDPGISVSRVGSSAQSKMMKRLAGSLKLELAQFREVEQFSKFGSELDPTTRKLLLRGRMMVEVLKQNRNRPLSIYKQLFVFYISSSPFFDRHALETYGVSLDEYFADLFSFIELALIIAPFKTALEVQNNVKPILLDLVEAHFKYFVESKGVGFSRQIYTKTYKATFSGNYAGSVDDTIRISTAYLTGAKSNLR
jgi:F-type H+/Na+-transporting ATPase subunit alpha